MCEIWKDVPGYEGYYQVSNKGRIKCLARTGEEFRSIKEAAKHYGVADTNLGNAIRGKGQKRCAGYHWEFITNNQ